MLQSGSCNGCGECPDAPVEVTGGGGGLIYMRRVYALFQGPSGDDCEATDTRQIELQAFYSKHPFGNLDHEYIGDYRDGALAPTATEPAVWATIIDSAKAVQSQIENPYWLDDDNRLRCKAKYIYTAYAYGQSSTDHIIIGGDGNKLLPVLAWLMPDPDDEQKCIWQAIAICGVCGEANVYNDSEVIIATEIFPPQPPFVCGLENLIERWENVEVTLFRTAAVAWTGRIKVDRNCPVGVPDLPIFFEQGNPCDCTPPTPEPECCNPQLYLTWKKTGGIECCGTDPAGVPNPCPDFVEPIPDWPWFLNTPGARNLEEVFIPGQPETRQWVTVWQLESAANGVGDGMACIAGCDQHYCRHALFIMIQCCTDGYYYKWEWFDANRRFGVTGLSGSGLWYNYFLPLWGPLECIGDPIAMDGTDCSCDFPNLPITTIGPFPGCDCQIEFEVRQHPLSTCGGITTTCCAGVLPEFWTIEILTSNNAAIPVGTVFTIGYEPTNGQWIGAIPGGDNGSQLIIKCCGGGLFVGYFNNSITAGCATAGVVNCSMSCLYIMSLTCEPFEATLSTPLDVLFFDGGSTASITFRATQ